MKFCEIIKEEKIDINYIASELYEYVEKIDKCKKILL